MSDIPADLKYAETHEWCRIEGNIVTLGITKHAADALTDLVCVEYEKEVGDEIEVDEEFGLVDSVKASEALISPIAGKIVELNTGFEDENNLVWVGEDSYGKGWLIKIEASDMSQLDGLMDAAAYQSFLDDEA